MCLLPLSASQPPPDGLWAPLLPPMHPVPEVSRRGLRSGQKRPGCSQECPSVATQLRSGFRELLWLPTEPQIWGRAFPGPFSESLRSITFIFSHYPIDRHLFLKFRPHLFCTQGPTSVHSLHGEGPVSQEGLSCRRPDLPLP